MKRINIIAVVKKILGRKDNVCKVVDNTHRLNFRVHSDIFGIEYFKFILNQNDLWENAKKFFNENKIIKVVLVQNDYSDNEFWMQSLLMKFKEFSIDAEIQFLSKIDEKISKDICYIIAEKNFYHKYINNTEFHSKIYTLMEFYKELDAFVQRIKNTRYSMSSETAGSYFDEMRRRGLTVCAFYNDIYYLSTYIKQIAIKSAKYKEICPINPGEFWEVGTEMYDKFFGELLHKRDYKNGKAQLQLLQGHSAHKKGVSVKGKYYNVKKGRRVTCYHPIQALHTIYFFGNCLIMGAYHEDKYTIASWLQLKLNLNGYKYKVENCGLYENIFETMSSIRFHKGDIAIIWTGQDSYDGCLSVELRKIFEKRRIPAEWCLAEFTHVNHKATEIIAEELFDTLLPSLQSNGYDHKDRQEIKFEIEDYECVLGNFFKRMLLERYVPFYTNITSKASACLVIDLSISPKDYLDKMNKIDIEKYDYFFVFVPDDIGMEVYSQNEYLSVILENNMKNVIIIPSGKYVPYFSFFHSYYYFYNNVSFQKEQAVVDIQIFSQCIAKTIGVTARYSIKSSSQRCISYNNILKDELPKYGIQYIEI